jgi:8-oxo-dGTP diphosphatase
VLFRDDGALLLVERGHPPHQGSFALPGGILEVGESAEEACRREMLEETGIEVSDLRLVGVYSEPGRDPRGHFITIAYLALRATGNVRAGSDAADAIYVEDWRQIDLAFDHDRIAEDATRLAASL